MSRLYCAVYGCLISAFSKPDLSFFKLPGDVERNVDWAKYFAESKIKYEENTSVNRYIKMHIFPMNWKEARFRCYLEGGILASPKTEEMSSAMLEIMKKKTFSKIYIGIHATYSKGDYTTVNGTSISELDVKWGKREAQNKSYEDCLVMDSEGLLYDVQCTNDYPFICHKMPDKMNAHSCTNPQNDKSDYVLNKELGSCYKFHKEGRMWPDAFKTCQSEDAYLAIINSEKESEFIKDLYAKNEAKTMFGTFHKDTASLGFSLWYEEEWFTIHGQTLSEAGFDTFHPGEPNKIGNNETCGSVWRSGLLNDSNCGNYLAFFCEKPITP